MRKARARHSVVVIGVLFVTQYSCQSLNESRKIEHGSLSKDHRRLDTLLKKTDSGLNDKAEQYEAFLVAERLAIQREFAAAEPFYRAVYQKTANLVVGIKLARTQTILGKYDQAEEVVRKLHLLFPKEPQPQLAEAYLAELSGSPNEAFALLKEAYKDHPGNAEVAARYIDTLLSREQKKEAESILRDSIRAIPGSPYFILKLAKIKFEEKNYTEAKNLLDSLLRIDPENIEGWTLAGFIALEEKNDESAEKYFRSAYEKQPQNDTLAKYYVAQLLKLERLQEAMRLLIRIEKGDSTDNPVDPDLKFQLAVVLFRLEEFEEAKQRFRALAEAGVEPDRMYFFAGQCEESVKQYRDAINFYERIERSSSLYAQSLQRRIISHLEVGEAQESALLLQEFSEHAEESLDSTRFIASVHARVGAYSKAIDAIRKAPSEQRKKPELRYLEAVYLEFTESVQASLKALEKLISDEPQFTPALNHLGYTLVVREERLAYATAILKRAVDIEPKNGFFLDSLGWAYFKQDNWENAAIYLQKALELEPEEPVILEHLGELYLRQRRFDLALRYFEQAMEIFKNAPDWKISSDKEWAESRNRVKKRIQELFEMAIPVNHG